MSFYRKTIVILACFAMVSSAYAGGKGQRGYKNTITVSAKAKATKQPEFVNVSVGFEDTSNTISSLQKTLSTKSTNIMNAIKADKANSEFNTNGVQIYPVYNDNDSETKIVGYKGQVRIQYRAGIQTAAKSLDDVISAGANRVYGYEYGLSDSDRKDLEKEAIGLASKDALEKAKAAATSLGLKDLEVQSIEIFNDNPGPEFSMRMLFSKAGGQGIPVESKGVSVGVMVQMKVEYDD